MLNIFYDFIPILLFFLVFKFYDIYAATVVGMVATGVQVLMTRLVRTYYDKKQVITFVIFLVFGGMTLYFHNPIFVKWKPTIIFWLFAAGLMFSRLFTQKTLLERLFDGMNAKTPPKIPFSVPQLVWRRLTHAWVIFFFLLGAINIYIAYNFSTETWVNFKFYGILGALILFSLAQGVYLARYFPSQK
jgi:intracellular septation protein